MRTKFNTMLAPLDAPTGDERRFASSGIELAPTPFPFEWVRERQGGHDGAVTIGVVQEATITTVDNAVKQGWVSEDAVKAAKLDGGMKAVWARGELFDDANREDLARLADDVAEVLYLVESGTLGPSVDLDSFEGIPVLEGSDEPLTFEEFERVTEETGKEPKVELLITKGRVRAATLVSIPAFMETSRPLELVRQESDDNGEAASTASLVASVSTTTKPRAELFDLPTLDRPTPITIDAESGRVYGHVATWHTCHTGFADVCITAPRDSTGDYAWFNRHPVEVDGGTVWAGRLTAGGRHPELSLTASATMAAYDDKITAAYVRASEDDHGIVVSGVLAPDLDDATLRTLARRKVSCDWRETSAGLSLVELLALEHGPRQYAEPGFPVGAHTTRGRQTALTASLGPSPDATPVNVAAQVREALRSERARERASSALSLALQRRERELLTTALDMEV